MKAASLAPFYGCLYPGLCDVARANGYALAIHGSMVTDLDLVAVPWTAEAVEDTVLVEAILKHCSAVLYPELLARHGHGEKAVESILRNREARCPSDKPHGRKCWSLHLDFGVYVDLSVMPRIAGSYHGASLDTHPAA